MTVVSLVLAALALRNPDFVCFVPAKVLSWVWAYLRFAFSRVLNRVELEIGAIFGWPSYVAPVGANPAAMAFNSVGVLPQQPAAPLTGWLGWAAAAYLSIRQWQ